MIPFAICTFWLAILSLFAFIGFVLPATLRTSCWSLAPLLSMIPALAVVATVCLAHELSVPEPFLMCEDALRRVVLERKYDGGCRLNVAVDPPVDPPG